MTNKPIITRILAELVLILSLFFLFAIQEAHTLFPIKINETIDIITSPRPPIDESLYEFPGYGEACRKLDETYQEARQHLISSLIKDSIFTLSLIGAAISSLIIIFRPTTRLWQLVLGSASTLCLVMFLIKFWVFSPFTSQTDIQGNIFSTFYCLLNLISAIYFLSKKKTLQIPNLRTSNR